MFASQEKIDVALNLKGILKKYHKKQKIIKMTQ